MTLSLPTRSFDRPVWSVQRASWYVVALHVPFVVAAPLFVLTRHHGLAAHTVVAVVIAAGGLGALQLRHSLAAIRGECPAGWQWTYAAMCLLAYLPGLAFGLDWVSTTQWLVIASGPMLLSRRLAVVTVIGPSIVALVWIGHVIGSENPHTLLEVIVWMAYYLVITVLGGLALYGSTRLVGVLDQLNAARIELAELAVGRERLRLSRDLHDLLGHSLSAVSLKGDLAIRLLPTDTERARTEIESLTGLARATLRDMRAVARDEHAVSLSSEVDAAVAVLEAAGVTTQVDIDLPGLPAGLEVVLAWAVREATTNVLRHSDAGECLVTASRRAGTVRLEIVNDGTTAAQTPVGHVGDGNGLAGLSERARSVAGNAAGRPLPGGRYSLLVEIPDVVA
jgi:two-component system, NarL family, sensor histidine kinase DesK